jgi:hypothetical protein
MATAACIAVLASTSTRRVHALWFMGGEKDALWRDDHNLEYSQRETGGGAWE